MAELVDALDSGSSRVFSVEVQLFLAASRKNEKSGEGLSSPLFFILILLFQVSSFYIFTCAGTFFASLVTTVAGATVSTDVPGGTTCVPVAVAPVTGAPET